MCPTITIWFQRAFVQMLLWLSPHPPLPRPLVPLERLMVASSFFSLAAISVVATTCLWGWWFRKIDWKLFLLNRWMYSCQCWWQWKTIPERWSCLPPFLFMCTWPHLSEFLRLPRTLVSQSWRIICVIPWMPEQNGIWMWSMFFLVRPCATTLCTW